MSVFTTAFGSYELQRLPAVHNESLRAWDAADEMLLQHMESAEEDLSGASILLINDQFGALAVSLHKHAPHSWSDSWLAHQATRNNLQLNQLKDTVGYLPSTEQPQGIYDWVLLKVPKSLALLEHQLICLKPHISANTRIVAAAMARHIHTSTLAVFEKILGTTTTSLARKKARLIFTSYEKTAPQSLPYPTSFYEKDWDIHLTNHANVFAREKLDIGARFMLQQLKQLPSARHILDLGCGNGVLGIIAQRLQPTAHVTFVDESYMAIASAKENYQSEFAAQQADFIVGNALTNIQAQDIDLILCNPPFHQQHSMGDHIAWEMFKQSRKHLIPGGQIWLVGNRHLNYHLKLKRLFGLCRQIAANRKFVVLAASKSG